VVGGAAAEGMTQRVRTLEAELTLAREQLSRVPPADVFQQLNQRVAELESSNTELQRNLRNTEAERNDLRMRSGGDPAALQNMQSFIWSALSQLRELETLLKRAQAQIDQLLAGQGEARRV
jgi:chromosome segregation ATPase